MSLYRSTLETNRGPLAVTVPVRHVGIVKADRPEARAAKTATIATAVNKPRYAPLLDESRPENTFSAHSLTRGRNLLSEGYEVRQWRRNSKTGEAYYFVHTPSGHEFPWYVVTYRDGGAECECPKGGLGKRTSLCCHVACIAHWDGLYPGLITAREFRGVSHVTYRGATGWETATIENGVEVAK